MNIILSQSRSPSFNLAAEEHLFSRIGEDFLLLYVNEPSVIIGSNQAVLNEVDQDFCIEHDIRIVRRLSGGGAVYHDTGNLNYSFIHGKTGEPLSTRFLDPVVETLRTLDIPVEVRKRKDLWLEGYKISGTASHLSKGREIHHGTLLYDTDLEMLLKALNPEKRDLVRKATASVPSPVKNIRSYLENMKGISPEPEQFFRQFVQQVGLVLGTGNIDSFGSREKEKIEVLQRDKYIQRMWNYRM
ncbi:Lipoate-protein ligase A [Proteiniphilum saccharofermentans]|uniref:Lipoate-protein ligase A n=1 Tax=Proteiniphilum saccharofermentans TaxID=1642647 RepID=A0A1R3TAG7_9BACT|nr:lipoate--protein ligase family protein [Proteiniphilum saccharofermentans]SCD20965.1 Lipoate-protein ligase A [Proteiniphilum saccharofermentans]